MGAAIRATGAAVANTGATQVRAWDASNTRITRTERHYAIHLGTALECCRRVPDMLVMQVTGAGELHEAGAAGSVTGLLKSGRSAVRPAPDHFCDLLKQLN